MNRPSPAIVSQDAVRRLPRWALLLLCVAYVVPGYVGREPWKNADLASFGYMLSLLDASDWRQWLHPTLMGMGAESNALLPYWLGAWAMQLLGPLGVAPDFAARVPYALALVSALVSEGLANITKKPPMAPLTGVRLARTSMAFDCSKARGELGWKCRSLDASLIDTMRWMSGRGLLRRPVALPLA